MKKKKIIVTILIITILIAFLYILYQIIIRKVYPDKYAEYIEKYSEEYNIEKEWIYALIKAESNFDVKSISQSGAVRTDATHGRNSIRSSRRYRNAKDRLKRTRM